MSYGFVVARSRQDRLMWERVLGSERVPVLDVRPRWIEFRLRPAWGYDVAVGQLHHGQVNRLAAHVARRNRVGYEAARSLLLRDGMTIRAADMMVVETADAWGIGRLFYGGWHGSPCWASV